LPSENRFEKVKLPHRGFVKKNDDKIELNQRSPRLAPLTVSHQRVRELEEVCLRRMSFQSIKFLVGVVQAIASVSGNNLRNLIFFMDKKRATFFKIALNIRRALRLKKGETLTECLPPSPNFSKFLYSVIFLLVNKESIAYNI
jgi:hypothetical protein